MKNHRYQFKIGNRNRLKISRIFGIFDDFRVNFRQKLLIYKNNKRDFRADGLPLLPSALRPRLLSNRGEKSYNVAKIVVMSIIFSCIGLFSLNSTTPVSAVSLTLSIPADALELDLQPDDTFTKSSSSSVSVKTDAFAGYTLSIKAKNSNELVNGNNKISSISGNLTEDQYKTSGNTNTWGYQPSKINGSANTAFLPGPTTSPSTIEKTGAKNDTVNSYNFAIGAKADSNTPNGSYSNTFIFTSTANTVSYNITYELNQGAWTGTNPQIGNTVEDTINLDSSIPTRDDYEFLGWCDQQTSDEVCNGTSYQPGHDYILTNGENKVTLWAIWKQSISYRSYTINYHNSDKMDAADGLPSTQSGLTSSADDFNITLSSDIPTLDGYEFNNWCSISNGYRWCQDRSTFASAMTTNDTFSPGDSIMISSDEQTIELYATWTPQTCNDTGIRMKDGKCWSANNVGSSTWQSQLSENWKECQSDPWRMPSSGDFGTLTNAYVQYRFDNGKNPILFSDFNVNNDTFWTSSETGTQGATAVKMVGPNFDSGVGYLTYSFFAEYKWNTHSIRCVSD